jgi:hypothetical protein
MDVILEASGIETPGEFDEGASIIIKSEVYKNLVESLVGNQVGFKSQKIKVEKI